MSSTKANTPEPQFSRIREALFPIHNIEIKKFLPLALIMLCILFNYTILRDTKDSLIATAPGAGPEPRAFDKRTLPAMFRLT